jgi:hypothetical protein
MGAHRRRVPPVKNGAAHWGLRPSVRAWWRIAQHHGLRELVWEHKRPVYVRLDSRERGEKQRGTREHRHRRTLRVRDADTGRILIVDGVSVPPGP